jgi:hypothetical protein
VPYRFRLGLAKPIELARVREVRPLSVYLTLGLSF